MNLIDKRPGEALLSELLPYVSFDETKKLLWLKDGSVCRVFSVIPKSCLSFTEDDLELLRMGLSSVLNQISENTFIQFLLIREKTNTQNDLAFQNWKNAHSKDGGMADENAMKLFQSTVNYMQDAFDNGTFFQTKIYITVRTSPFQKSRAGAQTGVFSHLIFNRESKSRMKSIDVIESETNQSYETLKLGLEANGFEVSDPSFEELFQVLFRFLNPGRKLITNHEEPNL